jgi:general secretion pathway protein A
MYERFYGLRERPFDLTPDPRYLVDTEVHREALSNLEYAIGSKKGITLLLGEAGTGKTTVINAAIAKQSARVHCVHLHNPALTRVEFVEMLAALFGLSERAHTSKTRLLIELEELLRARSAADETTVLIVDEAQSLSHELLEEIRLITNIETKADKLMSLIIAGQPEVATRLSDHAMRQLKQRIALRCELRPLNLDESVRYIAGRIVAAGGVPAHLFSREAVILMHERARGIPRTMNVLADNALVGGLAAQEHPVRTQIVRDVCRDFDIGREQMMAPAPASGLARQKLPVPQRAPRDSGRLTDVERRTLDTAVAAGQTALRTISSWAAPALSTLGLKHVDEKSRT